MTSVKKKEVKYETEVEKKIVEAIKSGKPLSGKSGVLTPIIKRALETALEGEIGEYLSNSENNRKNGKSKKIVKSSYGEFELETPRDRKGEFSPEIIKKRQVCLTEELDGKIMNLFCLGMSYRDIAENIKELYGINVENNQITAITDRLLPVISEWRNKPLDNLYPIIFLDGLFTKTRIDGRVINLVVYNIVAINLEGKKEILGFYTAETEGSKFWLSVLTDLKNRGLEDVLIVCCDGLKGFPEAIETVFPHAEVQLCIIHQIRNSLKYVSHRHKKEIASDLKLIYKSDNKEYAESQLIYFVDKWEKKYPIVTKSWQENWDNLSVFFKYNKMIRKIIYTTNIIEGFHRVVRKFTKTKGAFTSENALFKHIYTGIIAVTKKWNMPLPDWQLTISQLDIMFPNRINFDIMNRR